MKTKTNSIFITILSLVLGLFASASPCSCPTEISQKISTSVSTIIQVVSLSTIDGDICFDCGHNKSCCYSHKKSPVIASAASAAIVDSDDFVVSASPLSNFFSEIFSKDAMGAVGNRAPPWTVKPTLQNLHRKLLV